MEPDHDNLEQPKNSSGKRIFAIILIAVIGLSAFFIWTARSKKPTEKFGYGQIMLKDIYNGKVSPDWQLMRMKFTVMNDGLLHVVSEPRPGFNYGQPGDGRSAAAFIHIGDKSWKDYRLEMLVFSAGPEQFNPKGLPSCTKGNFTIYFRTVDYKENWNEPSRTSYMLNLNPAPQLCEGKAQPDSALYRINNWDAAAPGHGSTKKLATIDGQLWNVDKPNHVFIDVEGRNISIIINNNHALGYYDNDADALTYGGIGVEWGGENVGWLGNVGVTKL